MIDTRYSCGLINPHSGEEDGAYLIGSTIYCSIAAVLTVGYISLRNRESFALFSLPESAVENFVHFFNL